MQRVKDFDAKNIWMPKRSAYGGICQYAVAASKKVVQDSGIHMEEEDPYMVGISIGSRESGSLQTVENGNFVKSAEGAAPEKSVR